MDELADSAALASDPDGLRRRLAEDGYLFFRGLLPAGELRAVGLAVLARLRDGGWVDDRGVPSIQPRAVNSMDALTDPAFRAAMTSAEFNRVPYLPPLRAVIRAILGPRAFSYPVKVLRAVYPERPQARPRGRYIHCDYGVGGVQDMLTSWIPLSRLFSREQWWEPVPADLALYPRAELVGVPPGRSQLVAVHPGWKHWRPPPPAAVH